MFRSPRLPLQLRRSSPCWHPHTTSVYGDIVLSPPYPLNKVSTLRCLSTGPCTSNEEETRQGWCMHLCRALIKPLFQEGHGKLELSERLFRCPTAHHPTDDCS